MPAGRKNFDPTEQQRRMAESLAGCGMRQEAIARMMEIDPKTLRKHFRRELDGGADKANAQVAGTAFKMATSGECPLMTKFWLQTRNRWTSRPEYVRDEDYPLSIAAARAAIAEATLSRPKEDEDEEPITC